MLSGFIYAFVPSLRDHNASSGLNFRRGFEEDLSIPLILSPGLVLMRSWGVQLIDVVMNSTVSSSTIRHEAWILPNSLSPSYAGAMIASHYCRVDIIYIAIQLPLRGLVCADSIFRESTLLVS